MIKPRQLVAMNFGEQTPHRVMFGITRGKPAGTCWQVRIDAPDPEKEQSIPESYMLPLKDLSTRDARLLSPTQAVMKFEKEIRACRVRVIREKMDEIRDLQQQINKQLLVLGALDARFAQ